MQAGPHLAVLPCSLQLALVQERHASSGGCTGGSIEGWQPRPLFQGSPGKQRQVSFLYVQDRSSILNYATGFPGTRAGLAAGVGWRGRSVSNSVRASTIVLHKEGRGFAGQQHAEQLDKQLFPPDESLGSDWGGNTAPGIVRVGTVVAGCLLERWTRVEFGPALGAPATDWPQSLETDPQPPHHSRGAFDTGSAHGYSVQFAAGSGIASTLDRATGCSAISIRKSQPRCQLGPFEHQGPKEGLRGW